MELRLTLSHCSHCDAVVKYKQRVANQRLLAQLID